MFNRKEYMRNYNAKYREKHIKEAREYNLHYKKKHKKQLKKQRRDYIARNIVKVTKATRELKLKQRYGISESDYEKMYGEQHGKCAICGIYKKILNVDHCHTSGKVRELLCGKCNRELGHFQDNINLLINAVKYLKK